MTMQRVIITFLLSFFGLCFLPGCGNPRSASSLTKPALESTLKLPADFLWGTATAAEQIESTPNSNWADFIRDAYAGRRFETLAPGEAKPGHIHNLGSLPLDVVMRKTNHESLVAEDIAMAKGMANNAYRFSIAWDRLFPREGMTEPDASALAHYDRLFAALEANHIKPSVTLFHFSTPAWFWKEKDGKRGWERSDALALFEQFVRAVVNRYGSRVGHWCTLNEPMVFVYAGYMQGVHPPLETRSDVSKVTGVMSTLLKAHALSYRIIHEKNPGAEVGFTMHTRAFEGYRRYAPLDGIIAGKIEQAFIWDFVDAVKTGRLSVSNTDFSEEIPGLKDSMDYLGINYYGRHYVKSNVFAPAAFRVLMADHDDPAERINDLGWAHYPRGFYEILKKSYIRYGKPIYVLENGTADGRDEDELRQELLVTHIAEMAEAVHDGIPVKGYFHWSLMDNFEWAEGFEAKFGLASMDPKNGFRRVLRPSARLYPKIIEEGVTPDLYARYARLYQSH